MSNYLQVRPGSDLFPGMLGLEHWRRIGLGEEFWLPHLPDRNAVKISCSDSALEEHCRLRSV